MKIYGHSFTNFGSCEKICRCGFVIGSESTPEWVEQELIEARDDKIYCTGIWHVGCTKEEYETMLRKKN